MSNYAEKLKHPKWQKKRLEVFERDGFSCQLCKDKETTLHVHNKYYVNFNDPWDYPMDAFATLCEHCHTEVEFAKKEGIDFENISVYKCDRWSNGCVIMFLTDRVSGVTVMRIYDPAITPLVSFELRELEKAQIKSVFDQKD